MLAIPSPRTRWASLSLNLSVSAKAAATGPAIATVALISNHMGVRITRDDRRAMIGVLPYLLFDRGKPIGNNPNPGVSAKSC